MRTEVGLCGSRWIGAVVDDEGSRKYGSLLIEPRGTCMACIVLIAQQDLG